MEKKKENLINYLSHTEFIKSCFSVVIKRKREKEKDNLKKPRKGE